MAVPSDRTTLQLRHVLLFHRHGDRTPERSSAAAKLELSPEHVAFWDSVIATAEQLNALARIGKVVGADPSKPANVSDPDDVRPYGQLTEKGVTDLRSTGRTLRQRYGQLLDPKRPDAGVYVLSSNFQRTIQSVQSLLLGMFVDAGESDRSFDVRTLSPNVLKPAHGPKDFDEIERLVSDRIAQRQSHEREAMEKLGQYMRSCMGIEQGQYVPWTSIRHEISCLKAHNMPLHEGITPEIADQIYAYDGWLWHRMYENKAICRRSFQSGVQTVYDHLKRVASKDETSRISFFSAHDNSIVALVCALQLQTRDALPPYNCVLAFEVYEDVDSDKLFIKVLFDDKEIAFAGHEHDTLTSFAHFEALAQEFLN